MVEVRNVRKTFAETVAVESVSFTASPGGVFGLIGPNGAGKSTTIRMIMNIFRPDAGEVLFDGHQITEEDKNRIGYLPEERGLYKTVTVNEMLIYLAKLKGATAGDAQKRIDTWLERFKLSEWKHKKIDELSKGMSQKVQFIASIAHDPDIVFFDEPFSGLDPVSSDLMRDIILELGQTGRTVLISTHIMEHAEKICSDIVLINRGREVVAGPLRTVKEKYGHRSVIVEFDGDAGIFESMEDVHVVSGYPRYVELRLDGALSPDELLSRIAGRLSITRFEVATPSLHRIFVEQVGTEEQPNELH